MNENQYPIKYLRPEDVKSILQIGMTATYRLFHSNDFPSIKIGSSLRVEESKFIQWCEQNNNKGGCPD